MKGRGQTDFRRSQMLTEEPEAEKRRFPSGETTRS